MIRPRMLLYRFAALAILAFPPAALPDEGMWTIDNFPADAVAEAYDVGITDEWLHSAQLSTTRLENGCTGSFASANGLILYFTDLRRTHAGNTHKFCRGAEKCKI